MKRFIPTLVEQVLLNSIKVHLWNESADLVLIQQMNAESWVELYKASCSQGLQGVLYQEIQKIGNAVKLPDDLLQKWAENAKQVERDNQRKKVVLSELCHQLKKDGLNPVLLKGLTLAKYYPDGDLRENGAFDFWFPDREKEADAWFEKLGVNRISQTPNQTAYVFKGVLVVNHHSLLDQTIAKKKIETIEQHLKEQWEKEEPLHFELPNGETILYPNATFQVIFNACHITTHMRRENSKLCLLIDWAMVLKNYEGQYSQNHLINLFKEVGLLVPLGIITDIVKRYLGLPEYLTVLECFCRPEQTEKFLAQTLRPMAHGLKGHGFIKCWQRRLRRIVKK